MFVCLSVYHLCVCVRVYVCPCVCLSVCVCLRSVGLNLPSRPLLSHPEILLASVDNSVDVLRPFLGRRGPIALPHQTASTLRHPLYPLISRRRSNGEEFLALWSLNIDLLLWQRFAFDNIRLSQSPTDRHTVTHRKRR